MSVTTFESFSEQAEAKRLLAAALAEGPAHAYLFHGPQGVGKRDFARAFARELLDTTREVHPDLYELEALGEMIRIDAIRELRRDLHMRPFETDRRIYLVYDAHLLNEDAADALLKDLEEPPSYAVIVLVADDLGPIPETIRSRCQLVPFRRLSERAVREVVDARFALAGFQWIGADVGEVEIFVGENHRLYSPQRTLRELLRVRQQFFPLCLWCPLWWNLGRHVISIASP